MSDSKFDQSWNYKPDGAIEVSPFFSWPPDPARMATWVRDRWFFVTENTIFVAIAVACWMWASPSLETAKTLELGWVLGLYLRNVLIMTAVAGGLHWWFHGRRVQGNTLKYDPRDVPMSGKMFTGGSQLFDNLLWTLTSGVGTWTLYEAFMLWGIANGWFPTFGLADNPVWFVMLFVLTPVWISFHFYWIHRFLHWPPLYRIAHALHHRNTNVGPWSGLSMHPIEHVMFFSSVLLHMILAAHPVHIMFHMFHQALGAATSHTGFEGLVVKDEKKMHLGMFHHQMHHRYFECNYGNLEVPWDKWFGSFHDGTEEAHAAMSKRRKARHG